jgi:Fur family transcriptional regulator, ferric uptake regulator
MKHVTAAPTEHADFHPSQVARGRGNVRGLKRTRNTPRKRALLEVLEGADGFLSAAELHDRLCAYLAPQGLRVGIATVYNQLRGLAQCGAVDTFLGDDGDTRYWLTRQGSRHHYLVCRSCGKAVEIVADPVERWADTLGANFGFRDITHIFELFGLCDRCADPDSKTDIKGDRGAL